MKHAMARASNAFIRTASVTFAVAVTMAMTMAMAAALALLAPRAALALELNEARDCVIVPHRVIDVSSTVPGLLESVSIERSDRVMRGQELARLESAAERASVDLADAWASIESEIHLETISRALDSRRMERVGQLYLSKAAALDDKDKAETDASLAEVRLRQAREKRWIRELDAKKAAALLERRTVRSPIDGVVVERFRSGGEYVENQPIARIAQLDPLQVETLLPMREFGNIRAGMQASVRAEHDPEVTHTATVAVVDRVGDAASGTFGVRLSMPNPNHLIPAGLKCTLNFLPAQATAQLMPDASDAAPPNRDLNSDLNSGQNGDQNADQNSGLRSSPGIDQASPSSPLHQAATTSAAMPADDGGAQPQANIMAAPLALAAEAAPAAAGLAQHQLQVATAPAHTPAPRPAAAATNAAAGANPVCQAIGPLNNEQSARDVSSHFSVSGAEAVVHEAAVSSTVGYIVLSLPPTDDGAQHVQRMRDAGVHDVQLMSAGEFRGLVSLGVYAQASAAERRRAEIAARGFNTELRVRTRSEPRWWVTVRTDTQAHADLTAANALLSLPEATGAQILPCTAAEVPFEAGSEKSQEPLEDPKRGQTLLPQRIAQRS